MLSKSNKTASGRVFKLFFIYIYHSINLLFITYSIFNKVINCIIPVIPDFQLGLISSKLRILKQTLFAKISISLEVGSASILSSIPEELGIEDVSTFAPKTPINDLISLCSSNPSGEKISMPSGQSIFFYYNLYNLLF